jgi:hypothetical protein
MALEQLQFLEQQICQLDQEMASLLSQHQDAVQRLAEVPGLGVDSAQQIIAEVGPTASSFPSAKQISSWVGACPGADESAGVNYSHRSPKGNRNMRPRSQSVCQCRREGQRKHLRDCVSPHGASPKENSRKAHQLLEIRFSLSFPESPQRLHSHIETNFVAVFKTIGQGFCSRINPNRYVVNAYLLTGEALRLGIHPRTLYELRDRGELERIGRGSRLIVIRALDISSSKGRIS